MLWQWDFFCFCCSACTAGVGFFSFPGAGCFFCDLSFIPGVCMFNLKGLCGSADVNSALTWGTVVHRNIFSCIVQRHTRFLIYVCCRIYRRIRCFLVKFRWFWGIVFLYCGIGSVFFCGKFIDLAGVCRNIGSVYPQFDVFSLLDLLRRNIQRIIGIIVIIRDFVRNLNFIQQMIFVGYVFRKSGWICRVYKAFICFIYFPFSFYRYSDLLSGFCCCPYLFRQNCCNFFDAFYVIHRLINNIFSGICRHTRHIRWHFLCDVRKSGCITDLCLWTCCCILKSRNLHPIAVCISGTRIIRRLYHVDLDSWYSQFPVLLRAFIGISGVKVCDHCGYFRGIRNFQCVFIYSYGPGTWRRWHQPGRHISWCRKRTERQVWSISRCYICSDCNASGESVLNIWQRSFDQCISVSCCIPWLGSERISLVHPACDSSLRSISSRKNVMSARSACIPHLVTHISRLAGITHPMAEFKITNESLHLKRIRMCGTILQWIQTWQPAIEICHCCHRCMCILGQHSCRIWRGSRARFLIPCGTVWIWISCSGISCLCIFISNLF